MKFFIKNRKPILIGAGILTALLIIKSRRKKPILRPLPTLSMLPKATIQSIAAMQYQAMAQFGTDEELLVRSLEGLGAEDLKAVYNEFGLRPNFMGDSGEYFGRDLDLFGWYAEDLDPTDEDDIPVIADLKRIWSVTPLKFPY